MPRYSTPQQECTSSHLSGSVSGSELNSHGELNLAVLTNLKTVATLWFQKGSFPAKLMKLLIPVWSLRMFSLCFVWCFAFWVLNH